MLRKFNSKKAQNTAEYAILIALVVAGIVGMQTYAQRALQARVRDASLYMQNATGGLGNTLQYEPYYQQSNYVTDRKDVERELVNQNQVRKEVDTINQRQTGGSTVTRYDNSIEGIEGGI